MHDASNPDTQPDRPAPCRYAPISSSPSRRPAGVQSIVSKGGLFAAPFGVAVAR